MSVIIGCHGFGDCLWSLIAAKYVWKVNPDVKVLLSTRKEIFEPLLYAVRPFLKFPIEQIPEELMQNNGLLTDISPLAPYASLKDEIAIVWPDGLFKHPYRFNWEKYHVHPQTLVSTRLLKRRWNPTRAIYIGMVTSTPEYRYADIPGLIREVALALPDYEIHYPDVKQWAGKELNLGDFDQMFPSNVFIHKNPVHKEQIDIQSKCCFGIYIDNGPSHVAYHLGQPRILLDHRMGQQAWPWIARWRETTFESVTPYLTPNIVAQLAKTNIQVPQSCLVPRNELAMRIAKYEELDWGQNLILKWS